VSSAPRQGEIHYCHFAEPIKSRPVVILSRSEINLVRQNVVVALITRIVRQIPLEVPVGTPEGLPKDGVISLGDIHTVPRALLGEKLGELSSEKFLQAVDGLKLLFAIN
jgi:mRNA interferase MazF